MQKFDKTLQKYLEAITLNSTQEKEINKALLGILAMTLEAFPGAEVYAQGSFATDTMAKPLTSKQGGGKAGEYDIDIAIESEDWHDAIDALSDTAAAVEEDNTFGKLSIDKTKNSCIRIEYPEDKTGVAFHIDLVPTKFQDGERVVPNRDNNSWKASDAKQFAEWFNEKTKAEPGLQQVAIILKRLRDLADLTDEIKSIFILTLVTRAYHSSDSIMADLCSVLDGIATILSNASVAPTIENPVNSGEDLAAYLTDYPAVRSFFINLKQGLAKAISDDDTAALKNIFGPGFDYVAEAKHAYRAAATVIAAPTKAYGVTDSAPND